MTPQSAPLRLIALSSLLGFGSPLAAQDTPPPRISTNTEGAHFAEEEGREQAKSATFQMREDGQWRKINAFEKPQSEAKSPDAAQLIAAGETWRKHYEASNWDALRALYTDDAVLMSHDQNKIEGADNIVTFLQRLSKSGAKAAIEFRPEEAKLENGLGFLIAKYQMIIAFPGAAEPTVIAGRSFLVYKWVDGEWLIWRDIDNFAPDATPKDFE